MQCSPGSVTVGGGPAEDMTLTLLPGWNLIGIPMILQSGSDTAEIFKDVPSAGHSVFSYDPKAGWKTVVRTEVLAAMNAYWIYTEQQMVITLKVQGRPTAPKQLSAGWSIISIPGTTAVPAAQALASGEYEAAIAADVAAEHYGLTILKKNIGDTDGAVTRFVLVAKPGVTPKATGFDRTSLAAFIGLDHAGALLEILTEFAKREVNLTFIQSRPTGRELGHYHFIIDAEGHIDDPQVGAAVAGLRSICDEIRFLGSYPRADKLG